MIASQSLQSCGKCRFFRSNPDNEEQGQCRHSPPSVIVIPRSTIEPVFQGGVLVKQEVRKNEVRNIFPPIHKDDWGCYQFEEKEERNVD